MGEDERAANIWQAIIRRPEAPKLDWMADDPFGQPVTESRRVREKYLTGDLPEVDESGLDV